MRGTLNEKEIKIPSMGESVVEAIVSNILKPDTEACESR